MSTPLLVEHQFMHTRLHTTLGVLSLLFAAACSDSGTTATTGTGGSTTTGSGGAASTATTSGGGGAAASTGTGSTVDCTGATTTLEKVVCAANAFSATLTTAQKTSVQYAWTDSVAKTRWSNLPGVQRNGLKFGDLTAESRAAAMAVAAAVLSDAGYADFVGVLAADDYLGSLGSNGPGGGYSSDNYQIAFIGVPSTTTDWMLQIGGHHMAWNVTYAGGVGYPTPNHLGVEPKASFTINNASYQPMKEEGDALVAAFASLGAADLDSAYLTGQVFADVLLGPDEYASGDYSKVVFPTGANRTGVKVSGLSAAQQALVTAAIAQWTKDFKPEIADAIMADYTSAAAYGDTLLAWGGTKASGIDTDVNGTYLRIDGPKVWIEVACQGGIVVQGKSHLHSIYRDKTKDYGASL
jgi:hypothetical protein